jgi:hypothetical protein
MRKAIATVLQDPKAFLEDTLRGTLAAACAAPGHAGGFAARAAPAGERPED